MPFQNYARGFQHINRGPDKFWRVQQYLRFAWRFRGRKRNCYKIAIRYVHKALMRSTGYRSYKKKQAKKLWNMRLDAAAGEHGLTRVEMMEGLAQSRIQLDRKSLCDLAIYEPRTFQSLAEVAKKKMMDQGLTKTGLKPPEGVITRGML